MPITETVKESLITELDFIRVPGGAVQLGLDNKIAERFINSYGEVWNEYFLRETPQHEVMVGEFELAHYPVANGIYSQFIADDAYYNPDLWTPDGWAWRVNTYRTQPLFWNDPRFEGETRPVVGVSWFEAMALSRWISIQTGLNVRLPNEAEWEWAARGTNSRSLYPWGGAWDASKLNSGGSDENYTSLGRTAPVGSYSPAGDGPFGHGDLLGQVWEWTNTLLRPYPYSATDGREDRYTPDRRILRGGNWSDGKYTNRVTTRYNYPQNYSDMMTGVRLAAGGSVPPIAPRTKYDLILYARGTFCPDLITTKRWLHAWNVPYRQINVDMDEPAAFRLDKWLGSRTIPTLVVAERLGLEPITVPDEANLSNLRNTNRGSMLHEPEEATLRAFLIHHGFLTE